jgi:hypothetical protein
MKLDPQCRCDAHTCVADDCCTREERLMRSLKRDHCPVHGQGRLDSKDKPRPKRKKQIYGVGTVGNTRCWFEDLDDALLELTRLVNEEAETEVQIRVKSISQEEWDNAADFNGY